MHESFTGRIAFAPDEEVDVDLGLSADTLRLDAGSTEIGVWPLSSCRVTALGDDLFELHVDGDAVAFAPTDPVAFQQAVDQAFRPASLISRLRELGDEETPDGGPAPPEPSESAAEIEAETPDPWFRPAEPVRVSEPAGPTEGWLEPLDRDLPPPIGEPGDVAGAATPGEDRALPTVDGLWTARPAQGTAQSELLAPSELFPPSHDDQPDVEPLTVGPQVGLSEQGSEQTVNQAESAPDDVETQLLDPGLGQNHAESAPEDSDVPTELEQQEHSVEERRDPSPAGDLAGQRAADQVEGDGAEPPLNGGPSKDEPSTAVGGSADEVPDPDGEPDPAQEMEVASFGTVSGLRERPGLGFRSERLTSLASLPDPVEPVDGPQEPVERLLQVADRGTSRLASVTSIFGGRAPADDSDLADVFDPAEVMSTSNPGPGGPASSSTREEAAGPGGLVRRVVGRLASLKRSATPGTSEPEPAADPAGEGVPGPSEGAQDGSQSVADEILAAQRDLRAGSRTKALTPAVLKRVGLGAAGLAALVFLVWSVPRVVGMFTGESDRSSTATTVATEATTPPTTAPEAPEATAPEPPAPAVPVGDSVLDLTAAQFVERWDEVAGPISPELVFTAGLLPGEFEAAFTPYVKVEGAVETDGTLDWITLVVDPTGPSEHDRLGMQTLGVLLAVAEPGSSGSERAATLAALGLDVTNPQLEGISADLTRDDVRYALEYDSETVTLRLTLATA